MCLKPPPVRSQRSGETLGSMALGRNFAENQAQAKRSPVLRKNVTTGQRMHIYGTTALGTGRSTITFTAPGGRQRTFSGRFVHLWMNRSGAWQMVCDEWYDDPATVQPQ